LGARFIASCAQDQTPGTVRGRAVAQTLRCQRSFFMPPKSRPVSVLAAFNWKADYFPRSLHFCG